MLIYICSSLENLKCLFPILCSSPGVYNAVRWVDSPCHLCGCVFCCLVGLKSQHLVGIGGVRATKDRLASAGLFILPRRAFAGRSGTVRKLLEPRYQPKQKALC